MEAKRRLDRKYSNSPKGKLVKSKSQKKYANSKKGRAKIRLANVSPKAKARKLRYAKSRKGQAARKI